MENFSENRGDRDGAQIPLGKASCGQDPAVGSVAFSGELS